MVRSKSRSYWKKLRITNINVIFLLWQKNQKQLLFITHIFLAHYQITIFLKLQNSRHLEAHLQAVGLYGSYLMNEVILNIEVFALFQ